MLHLSKHLTEHNWNVSVCSDIGNVNYGWFGYETLEKKILHFFFNTGKSSFTENKKEPGKLFLLIRKYLSTIQKELLIPDYTVIKFKKIKSTINEAIDAANPSIVLFSGPPHGILLHTSWVKEKYPEIKIIVDYRDTWNTQEIFRKNYFLLRFIEEYLERRSVSKADMVVCASPNGTENLNKFFKGLPKTNVETIYNGYDQKNIAKIVEPLPTSDKVIIGYFGAISDQRSSYRSIRFLLNLIQSHSNFFKKFEFWFFGDIHMSEEQLWEHPAIKIKRSVSNKEALVLMKECTALLVVHTDEKSGNEPIPGKIYDYLASGKPTLAFLPRNSASTEILAEVGNAIILDYQKPDEIMTFFRSIAEGAQKFPSLKPSKLSKYTRENQCNKYRTLLESLLSP